MRIPRVDQDLCIGCGNCVALCPEVFELLPEGKSHVIKEDATCDLDAAVSSCPVQAISIVER